MSKPTLTAAQTKALRAVAAGVFTSEHVAALTGLGLATFRTVDRASNGRLLTRAQWTTVATLTPAGRAAL